MQNNLAQTFGFSKKKKHKPVVKEERNLFQVYQRAALSVSVGVPQGRVPGLSYSLMAVINSQPQS